MHFKSNAGVQQRTASGGSSINYNRSASAADNNFENAVVIQGPSVIQKYQADFEKIWAR